MSPGKQRAARLLVFPTAALRPAPCALNASESLTTLACTSLRRFADRSHPVYCVVTTLTLLYTLSIASVDDIAV